MPRIVFVTGAPLLADGLTAALRGHAGWDVRPGRVDEEADAWVLAGDELVVRGAQGAGAQLSPDASAGRLRAAVAAVLEGLSVREVPWLAGAPEHEPLTPRELEVFELLGKGLSNREIGGVLGAPAAAALTLVSAGRTATAAATLTRGARCRRAGFTAFAVLALGVCALTWDGWPSVLLALASLLSTYAMFYMRGRPLRWSMLAVSALWMHHAWTHGSWEQI